MVRTIDKATLTPAGSTRLFGAESGTTGNFDPEDLLPAIRGREFNVRAYGAVCDGATSDGAAINLALAAAHAAGGGDVLIPGVCATSVQIHANVSRGVNLVGLSKAASRIVALSALGTTPVVKFTDHRDCGIYNLRIDGSGTSSALVQSYRSAASTTSPPYPAHQLYLRDVRLGGDSVAHAVCFQTACAGGSDTNNDYHDFSGVEMYNASVAAIQFGHYNSLCHTIHAPNILNCPIAIQVTNGGGSFALHGGFIGNITDVVIDLAGSNGGVNSHVYSVHGTQMELVQALLRTDTNPFYVEFHGISAHQASGNDTSIDVIAMPSAGGMLGIYGGRIYTGQTGCALRLTGAGSRGTVHGLLTDLSTIEYNGHLHWAGNSPRSGTTTFTDTGAGRLSGGGDDGGPLRGLVVPTMLATNRPSTASLATHPQLIHVSDAGRGNRLELFENVESAAYNGISREIQTFATWDINGGAAVAAGVTVTTDLTLSGVTVGESVVATHTVIINKAEWRIDASVISTNNIRVYLTNLSGGDLTPGTGTVRVFVTRPA